MLSTLQINQIIELLSQCSKIALEIYLEDYEIITKEDNTPVTKADFKINQMVTDRLKIISPDIPIVSEESELPEFTGSDNSKLFWLLDPIDGTKDFIHHSSDWAISLGLIYQKKAIAGFLALPYFDEIFYGLSLAENRKDIGAWKISNYKKPDRRQTQALLRDSTNPVDFLKNKKSPLIYASIHHLDPDIDEYLERFTQPQLINMGSCIKFCRLAENIGDIYPRAVHLKEWDIAAGHAVLKAAGGNLYQWNTTKEITYANPDFEAPTFEAW